MSEQFSLSMLENEIAMYEEFIDVPFQPLGYDKIFTIKLYPFFKPEKVQKLVNEFFEFLNKCKDENITVEKEDEMDILGYFIIKYFTTVNATESEKAIDIHDEFKRLKNSKIYPQLMKLFPEESINSIMERKNEIEDVLVKFGSEIMQLQKQVDELPLDNREEIMNAFKNKDKSYRNVLAGEK